MKRLQRMPMTEEDINIWCYVGMFGGFCDNGYLELASFDCDGQDAELMLLLMETRGQWIEEMEWQRMLADRGLTWTHQGLLR